MSNLSILIVEDEVIVAEDLAGKVQQLGYDVAGIIATGEEAIELTRQHQPSLVLMDIRLSGGMDGIEAAQEIHRACDIPVLFLTAYSDTTSVHRAQQANAFGYILKPYDERDLRIQIEMAFYKHDAEQRLREDENRFRALFNNITESIFVHGVDGDKPSRYYAVNDVACERLGYSQEELLTMSPFDIDDPDSGLDAVEIIKNLKLDTNVLFEQVHLTRDKRRIDMELSVRLFMYRGEPTIICTGRDITERKLDQKKLLALNEELEQRVQHRTLELQEMQRQILHTEKLAETGKLSASIAHEFNNPLQGILSILKGLKKRAILEEEDKELLDAAIIESDRIKDLIRSLQDFNRPSSDRNATVDLHKSLDSILLLQKSDFNAKRISVVRNYTKNLPTITAVPDQIKQVFLNLLTNATDACHKSGGVITVSTRQENNSVAVTIQDTGVGINSSEKEQIFRPFFTTKSKVKGTGLGLSVSYGIIKKHHGEIRVESQPGEGATFTVLLPIEGTDEAVPSWG